MWPQRPPQIRDAAEGRVFVDAAAGRKYIDQQHRVGKQAAWVREEQTKQRHAKYRAAMEDLHRKHPKLSGAQLAGKVSNDLGGLSKKTLENLWCKWRTPD
jgi:hypothetical protein